MSASIGERVRKRRETLRREGLRPLQIWVPDTRRPGFSEECSRQSVLVAMADAQDRALMETLDAALVDLDEETS